MREISKSIDVQGVKVPRFLYGTAWKEDRSDELVERALEAGFAGIDTANQRKHYHEGGVGEGLGRWLASTGTERSEIFLQTKFTHLSGQDHRLPYDSDAAVGDQVRQSFDSSLEHLGVEWIDSLLIHGPSSRRGWIDEDVEVWRAMEELQQKRLVRLIGVSNVTAEQLDQLCDLATVPPVFVQNRCYAHLGWDRATRSVCARRSVVYQGFSLLTANVQEIRGELIQGLARSHGKAPAQIIFRFALQVGMICLTGTTDPAHMALDLDVFDFELSPAEVAAIESVSG